MKNKFNIGDKILLCFDSTDPSTIREYTVVTIGKDTVNCGGDNTFYTAFCWPIRVKAELLAIVTERAKLKAALDDSIKLIYELNNKISRGEL